MKSSLEAVVFFLVVPLVAVGIFYSPERGASDFRLPSCEAGARPQIVSLSSGNQIAWCREDDQLLLRYRGGRDFESQLALLTLAGDMTRIPFDSAGDLMKAAALFTDGRHVLIGTQRGQLWWIDSFLETGPRLIVDLQRRCSISSITVAEDGRRIAVGTASGEIHLFEVDQTPERDPVILSSGRPQSLVGHLRFSQGGERLLAASNDGRVSLWDVPQRRLISEFTGHSDVAKGAEFLAEAGRIISAGLDDTVRIWEVESGRELWRGDFGLMGIHALAVSRDGRLAAWGGNSPRIIVWDLETRARRFHIACPLPVIYHLGFAADGTKLAAVGRGADILLYDTETALKLSRLAFEEQ